MESRTNNFQTESELDVPKVTVPSSEVHRVGREILEAGLPKNYRSPDKIEGYESPADLVATFLMDADAQGHPTHGVSRLMDYSGALKNGRINPNGKFTLVVGSNSHAVFKGGGNFGQVTSQLALQHALDTIESEPTFTAVAGDMYHAGRIETYTRQALRKGYGAHAFITVGGAGRSSPADGMEPRFGTNPIAYGVPDGGHGVSFDSALPVVRTEGAVQVCHQNNLEVPDGTLRMVDGSPTNNPALIYTDPPQALINSLGGHKGSGVAMTTTILAHQMTNRGPEEKLLPKANEFVLFLINLDQFRTRNDVAQVTQADVARFKSVPTVSGKTIRMPGEGGLERAMEAYQNGIPVFEQTWKKVMDLHREVTGK